MTQYLLEMAKDLTCSLVKTGRLSSEAMRDTLYKTYATLTALKAQEEAEAVSPVLTAETAATDWKKSITKHAITCLECRVILKQLSARHLRMHGLDARAYRTKFGIPRAQPLSGRATTMRRRQVAGEIRPWENTPQYRQRRARKGD